MIFDVILYGTARSYRPKLAVGNVVHAESFGCRLVTSLAPLWFVDVASISGPEFTCRHIP